HDTYIAHGFFEDKAVDGALYWATRIAGNLRKAQRYASMREQLHVIIWEHFRVLGHDRHAISHRGPEELDAWAKRYVPRLASSHMVDGRSFCDAIDALLVATKEQAALEAAQ